MAPKRASKKPVKDDFVDDDEDFSDEEEEEEVKPKKAKAAAKPKPKKKKAADEDEDDEGEEKPKPKRAKPGPKLEGTTVADDGWTLQPPSLLHKAYGENVQSVKIAGFDLDGTLTETKSGARFPKGPDDWKWAAANVVEKVKGYSAKGYKVVIFSNQGGIKSALTGKASENFRGRVDQVVKQLGVPVVAIAATMTDEYRKPGTGMWGLLSEVYLKDAQPDLKESFFVGDSIDGGDEGFAEAIGIPFRKADAEFGSGPNSALVAIFNKLADLAPIRDPAKGHFAAAALRKAGGALKTFPKAITDDPQILKEVAALQGVGKGSMAHIKEWVTTGRVEAAEVDAGDVVPKEREGEGSAPAVAPTKKREDAMQFL